ncbi:substrate-binding domain-containing protein [Dyadobacter sp. CY312]|uniref:substrate-binding domain-containing protein n=1 Tax=Dyadobacter sp. CY312 TaxID=2907303 RepID=UPI001F244C9C|nr:substrate-binding domain-containing protein [Dyadobacter sp. CY312]MCE7042375.1 substrate-binding domain-containing protein [Dyadobacter sp. CY312]
MKYFAVAFLLLFLLTACSKKESKQYTVGFSQCTGADNWRKTMQESMYRELSFNPEINFVMKDAGGQSDKQITQIEELIKLNVDLLIISPNEAEPITPIAEKAYQNGIPVIILDRRTNSDQYTAYVGADNLEVGQIAGAYTNTLLKGTGKVIEISEKPGSSADIDRHKGFMETINRFPGIQLIAKLDGDWDKYSFEAPLTKLLKEHTDIDVIFCQNDRRALTAFKVCKDLGIEKRIRLIGVDGLTGPNGGIDLVDKGILNATILYPTGGEEAIRTAISILQKKPFKRENRLQITTIDSTNVRIMKLQSEKLVAQQQDIERRQEKIEEQRAISENQSIVIYTVSITLALALIFGAISFYSLRENRKINRRLEVQNHEISDHKNQIEQLAQSAEIENEAKLKFFTNISHEFRTPLTLILAPVEDVLASDKIRDPLIKQELSLIRKNTLRLLRLVTQLMDFRKLGSHRMQVRAGEHNLVAFVKDIMVAFERIASKHKIDFQLIASEAEMMVWFDTTMLDKVIFNLLSNAFKFTPDKGRVYLYIKSITPDHVQITVEDNGIGMTESEVAHVFEVFYQAESNYKALGTGLGLALSRELISLHKGTISVRSQPNKETAFTIELPLGNNHFRPDELRNEQVEDFSMVQNFELNEEIAPINVPAVGGVSAREQSVLIIEDNSDLVRLLEQKLQTGYQIFVANDGEEGLRLAFEHIPDLIVCDVMLPKKDGLSVTSILKTDFRTSHIPVILLTARTTTEQQIEGIQTGVDAYITKPFNLLYVQEMIKTLLKNRALLREHYTSELPIETSSGTNPNKLDKKFITQFTAYIEEHYDNSELSVEDIGKDMGMSRVQLYRKVKALLGMSVNEYMQQVRLNKARFLLRRDDLTVADIAYKVGFSSPTYFSTAFKGKYNQTPMEYKKSS